MIRFLAQREDGTSLALVRIAVGLVVAWDLASTWPARRLLWGDVRETPEGFRAFDEGGLFGLVGTTPATVDAVIVVTAIAALTLAAGLGSRVAALVALQGCIAIFGLNPLAGGGHDRVATNALWLLVLADAGRTLSLGCRLRTGSFRDPTPVLAWPRRLMVLQLVVMYTATGLQKMAPEWFPWGGALAIHNMLLVPAWARFDLAPWLGPLGPVTRVATIATWLWESTFWMVLAWPRARGAYAAAGVVFHVGLALVANLGPFSAISLALYPSLRRRDTGSG